MDLYIIGNGFTLSFLEHFENKPNNLNPSKPLRWVVPDPTDRGKTLISSFRVLSRAIEELSPLYENNDYEVINRIAEEYESSLREDLSDSSSAQQRYEELRRYLSLAYSYFDECIRGLDFSNWAWYDYLSRYRSDQICGVSFNYDLVFERTLRKLGLEVYGPGIDEEQNGVFVAKPHGSIDFDISSRDISFDRNHLTLSPSGGIVAIANNTGLQRLPDDSLFQLKLQYEIVPPMRESSIKDFQWVEPMYSYLQRNSDKIKRCFIIGHSYSEPDRPEIDKILNYLKQGTKVIIVNKSTKINDKLKKRMKKKRLQFKVTSRAPVIRHD